MIEIKVDGNKCEVNIDAGNARDIVIEMMKAIYVMHSSLAKSPEVQECFRNLLRKEFYLNKVSSGEMTINASDENETEGDARHE